MLTRHEVEQQYGCTKERRCIDCEISSRCTKGEAQRYKIYKKKRNASLKRKYFCEKINGRCKLNKCHRYLICTKKEKKNLEAWHNAFEKSKKEELERLSRGNNI